MSSQERARELGSAALLDVPVAFALLTFGAAAVQVAMALPVSRRVALAFEHGRLHLLPS